jgi:HD-GYP domain-containing protein (c-di-GMP phosphodiesterase class II)
MPLLIPTDELVPGMTLTEPVMANRKVMMQRGRVLTHADIDVIQRRYPQMRVRVDDPVLDEAVEFEDDSRERSIAHEAQQRVSACMNEVAERFAGRTSTRCVDFNLLQQTVAELLDFLKSNPASAALINNCMDSKHYHGVHTGNVFYLSMLLGSTVIDYVISERKQQVSARDVRADFASDLTPLALGAMVMDLGMLPLKHLIEEQRPLTPEDSDAIRQHPLVGAAMLPDNFSAVARNIVKTHHENMDGTGYPVRLTRDRIHVFARIVRIADAFDAATSVKVYRGAKSPARALWEMASGPYRRFYDARLMQSFVTLIQPFQVGSKIRLRDGRYAAVVRYNRQNPFDPQIIVAFDASNQRLPKSKLEGPLYPSTRRDLRLASLGDEDLTFLYASGVEEVKPGAPFREMLESVYP